MMFFLKICQVILLIFTCLVNHGHSAKFAVQNYLGRDKYDYKLDDQFVLSNGPIFAKSWMKYITYNKEDEIKPEKFFKNSDFYKQMQGGQTVELTKKDSHGYVNIPDDDHFYFIVTQKNLNVLSSRKVSNIITHRAMWLRQSTF